MTMNNDIEHIIVSSLFTKEQFLRKVVPFMELEYFTPPYQDLFRVFVTYVAQYNKSPSPQELLVELDKYRDKFPPERYTNAVTTAPQMFIEPDVDDDWLIDVTETWCKERAIHNALMRSISILDDKDKSLSKDGIPGLLQDALAVSFDVNVGHDYIDNAEQRYEFYTTKESRIVLDLDILNEITQGGLTNKSMAVIIAPTGVGKSLVMCHMAAGAVRNGYNVLYITAEMAEYRIAERIDANLFDVPIDQLSTMSKDMFMKQVEKVSGQQFGRLVVKEYPTGQAHSGHFRALLNELKLKKKFKPHIIFVDYLNICASAKLKGIGGSVNSYTYVKTIAEELRGLAVEQDLPIVTATQTNRAGYNNTDPDLDATSESYGLPSTADLMLALISTEELEQQQMLMWKQLKNRYRNPSHYRRFVTGIDRSKMQLKNIEQIDLTQDPDISSHNQPAPVSADYEW